jgi:hypothetical protein
MKGMIQLASHCCLAACACCYAPGHSFDCVIRAITREGQGRGVPGLDAAPPRDPRPEPTVRCLAPRLCFQTHTPLSSSAA